MTATRTRRVILLLVLAFVVYSVITNPNQSAAFVRTAFVALAAAVNSIFAFFRALLPK